MSKKDEGKGKLNEEGQKRTRGYAKILEIFSKVGLVILWIAIVCLAITTLVTPIVMKSVKISENEITIKDEKIEIKENEEDELDILYQDKKIVTLTGGDRAFLKGALENLTAGRLTAAIMIITISGIVVLVIGLMSIKVFIKIITSIEEDPTPFNAENPVRIRKIGKLMLASFLISFVCDEVVDAITKGLFAANQDMLKLLVIVGVFLLSYIFEYGFELQKESDSTLYDR